jgi:cytochrome b involved in lipid metabolism
VAVKRLIYSAFIAFVASVATIVILASLSPRTEKSAAEKERLVSLDEIARHSRVTDCWMAIAGNVYDFTNYISLHPAAPAVLTKWCGQEATEAFNTKGYGSPHSPAARGMLPKYFVGKLREK